MEKDTNIRKIALIMRLQKDFEKTMDAPIVLGERWTDGCGSCTNS